MTELPETATTNDSEHSGVDDNNVETTSNNNVDTTDEHEATAGKRQHGGEGTTMNTAGDAGSTASSKRGKREWLAFRGTRKSRVGDDYQVAVLPTIGTTTTDTTTNTSHGTRTAMTEEDKDTSKKGE